jgi:hypothetical protein
MRNPTKYEAEVITALHPLFRGLQWVSVARSTDDTRFALQHVHIEKDGKQTHIVATDGKRIHIHTYDPGLLDGDITPIEDGDYEIITKAAKLIVIAPATDDDLNYPNWRALLPDTSTSFYEDVVTRASVGRIGIRSGVLLATDFACDACGFGCGFGKDESVSIRFSGTAPGEAMTIKHDLGRAIVMPMRLSDAVTKGTDAEPPSDTDATPENPVVGAALAKLKQTAKASGATVEVLVGEDVVYDSADDEEEDDSEAPSALTDYDVEQLLIDLEKCAKLTRNRRLTAMLDEHGPDLIHRFSEYKTWNEADPHLILLIKKRADNLAKIEQMADEIKGGKAES